MTYSKSLTGPLVLLVVVTLVCMALFAAIRTYIVEPDEMAAACIANPATMICKIRNAAVYGFSHEFLDMGLFSLISLIAAALAWIGAMRLFAVVAVIAGCAGVGLYDLKFAAFGLLLGVVLYLRLCLIRVTQTG